MSGVGTRRSAPWRKVLCFGFGILAAAVVAAPKLAAAGGINTLYAFCGQANCADGSEPRGNMILDSTGDLYGITLYGGAGFGTVFRQRGHALKVLHSFCADCADGASPTGSLIMDVNGHLYGTATAGGAHGAGTVFELVPNAKRTKWKIGKLYSLCALQSCADGANPAGGLTYKGAEAGELYDGISPLYGTAKTGGLHSGGVVFQLVPSGPRFKAKVVYNFCSQDGCTDGSAPDQSLIFDSAGNLYGTTRNGGTGGTGVVFQLTPKHAAFSETVLHSFGATGDGASPNGPLNWDGSGNLVGTTESGGANGSGTVFRVIPAGVDSTESLVYSFCAQTNCIDGHQPVGGVLLGAGGDLFGLTRNGGGNGLGTAFRLTGSSETVVYSFCTRDANCTDGAHPEAGLVADGTGGFFGTTDQGGVHGGGGIVFHLSP